MALGRITARPRTSAITPTQHRISEMSLRAKHAARLRQKVMDAAELLIRQTGGTDFSMRALATAAEVSAATPYNFFGSKEGLLFELLNRSLASIKKDALIYSSDDPIEHVIEAVDHVVDHLVADPELLRPLYQIVLGLTDPIHHPSFIRDALVLYRKSLDALVEKRLLVDERERMSLACSLMAHVIGMLSLWVHEDIDDDWFRAQLALGFINLLWPLARGKSLKRLQERSAAVRKALSARRLPELFAR